MTIGERIRQIRKANKKNLDDFGKMIDVTGPMVSMMENGKAAVIDRTIKAICREFNVSEDWLRTGEGDMYRKSTADALREIVQSHNLTERDYDLIRWFAGQDDQTRKTILDAIVTVADIVREKKAPAEPRNVHEWTREEMHTEVDRQLDAEQRDRKEGTGEPSTGSPNVSAEGCV